MRVAFLIDDVGISRWGGAATTALLTARAMADQGVSVKIFSAGRFDQIQEGAVLGLPIVRFPSSALSRGFIGLRRQGGALTGWLIRELEAFSPAIVQVHVIQNYLGYDVLPLVKSRLPAVLLACHMHDSAVLCPAGWRCRIEGDALTDTAPKRSLSCTLCQRGSFSPATRNRAIDSIARACDVVTYVSLSLKQFWATSLPGLRHEVIYSGYDFLEGMHFGRVEQAFRSRPPLMVTGGRMKPYKGYAKVVEALAHFQPSERPRLAIYGEKGSFQESLQQLAAKVGVIDSVEFSGWLEPKDLRRLLETADAGIVPSLYPDPLPRAVFDYIVAGVPVIASSLGGVGEVIEHGRSGLIVNPTESGSIAQAARKILNARDIAREFSERARTTLRSKFDVRENARSRIALYRELLEA